MIAAAKPRQQQQQRKKKHRMKIPLMNDTFYLYHDINVSLNGKPPAHQSSLSTLSRHVNKYGGVFLSLFLRNECKILFYDFTPKIDDRNQNLAHANSEYMRLFSFSLSRSR